MEKKKTEFFHRAKKSVSIFSSYSKNHFYLYSYENQKLDIREIIQTRNEKEKEMK